MKFHLTLISACGISLCADVDKKPTLQEMYDLVGCTSIQLIPEFKKFDGKSCQAWCDEEGALGKIAPRNDVASQLWHAQLEKTGRPFTKYLLLGNVLIVQRVK